MIAVTGCRAFWLTSLPVARSKSHRVSRYTWSFWGSILYVRSSTSMNSGEALAWEMASAVAINVFGTVTTASPGQTPAATSANLKASVPLPTPTQCWLSQYRANSRSKSSTIEPPTNPALLRALRKIDTSSFSKSR